MLKMKCTELRQRKRKVVTIAEDAKKTDGPEHAPAAASATGVEDKSGESLVGSFWFTRVVFLRALSFIYFVAFAVALNQNKELVGDNGLLPVKLFLQRIKAQISGKGERFLAAPTVLWLADPWDNVDDKLDWIAQAKRTDLHNRIVQRSAKVGAPGLVNSTYYCCCLSLLLQLACSIHATWCIDFSRILYSTLRVA